MPNQPMPNRPVPEPAGPTPPGANPPVPNRSGSNRLRSNRVRPNRSRVPWWAVVSSIAAPVAMIGGWQLAAARQPPGYNPIRQTISALAAHGAHDRWVMTAGLAALGACHVVTACGLRPARPAGRVLLGIGGAATVLVAALPQPANGSSPGHTLAAGTAFVALSLWPLAANVSWPPTHTSSPPANTSSLPAPTSSPAAPTSSRSGAEAPPPAARPSGRGAAGPCPPAAAGRPPAVLRLPVAAGATVGSVVLLAVFFAELHGGNQIGLTERLLAGAQSLWPAVVAWAAYRAGARDQA